MKKKGQVFDIRIFSALIAIILILVIGIPMIETLVSTLQQPTLNIESIILPLVILAIFFEIIRRMVR